MAWLWNNEIRNRRLGEMCHQRNNIIMREMST